VDAGLDAGPVPIVAPDDQWTWVDFPESKCAAGTPTGLAVNPHAGATELLVYFEGGGECYDATTCWGSSPSAKNLTGYDATTFSGAPQRGYAILDRVAAGNPFAAMNMVYVPYCTGDLHSGTKLTAFTFSDGGSQPTYFYGATDLGFFLARLVPTFSGTTHVWAAGTSAGGFATYLDFDQLYQAFGVRVDILDDSGPPLVTSGGTSNQGLFTAWDYQPPASCASPCNSFSDVLTYDLGVQQTWSPPGRFGFLTLAEDTVISADFGYTLAQYPGLMDAFSASLPAAPAAATFIVTNLEGHVVESEPGLATDYFPWMTQMATDAPTWPDVVFAADAGP
jgi:hypothetical protein